MSKFCNERINSISPYVPGEQPQDKKYIKLNTNENPYYTSKTALDAINEEELYKLKLYSDPDAKLITKSIADYYGVKESNVLVTNGSDEILAFSFMAFCQGKKTAFLDVTYGFYKVYAKLFGVKYKEIPLKDDFSIDEEALKKFKGNLILANPNAQTGLFVENSKIEEILKSNTDNLVLIDEAYADFALSTAVPLTKKYENLLIVGTFSKSRSLAGARIGFAIGNKELIEDLKKVKYSFNPYNVNRLSQILGQKAIEDKDYFIKTRDKVIKTRENLKIALKDLGFNVLDSKANFVLASTPKISGEKLYLKLKDKGVLVRHFKDERIKDYIRITVGTDEETIALIESIEEIFKEIL